MTKERLKLLSALLWLAASVCSLFVSVISYTNKAGKKTRYALQDLLNGKKFSEEVLKEYTGEFRVVIGNWVLVLLCVLAVAAILAAFIGIIVLSKQRPVKWPFVMTVIGLIGTAIPSLTVAAAVAISVSWFKGTVSFGIYPIVTPLAMLVCLFLVVQERKRVRQAIKQTKAASDLIFTAGDLQ